MWACTAPSGCACGGFTALPQGSYTLLPREMHHFALSKTATVVQVHGNGPFQINFVNPADDPRKKTAAR